MYGDFGIGRIFYTAIIGVVLTIICFGYIIWNTFIADHKVFKTQKPPVITWELKAKGQSVDTIWIYTFK